MSSDGRKSVAIKPAFQLEQALGLAGVGQHYVMPEGKTMESLDLKFFDVFVAKGTEHSSQKAEVAQSYAKLLASLNPAMEAIRPNEHDYEGNVAFIRGMAAGYNKDDIEFFLHIPEETRKEIYEKQRAFLEKAGIIFLGWAPSPKTFEKITAQLAEKYGPDWQTTRKAAYDGRVQTFSGSRLFIEVDME
jgi:hypothetical protein